MTNHHAGSNSDPGRAVQLEAHLYWSCGGVSLTGTARFTPLFQLAN
jgi:hypothetical protein